MYVYVKGRERGKKRMGEFVIVALEFSAVGLPGVSLPSMNLHSSMIAAEPSKQVPSFKQHANFSSCSQEVKTATMATHERKKQEMNDRVMKSHRNEGENSPIVPTVVAAAMTLVEVAVMTLVVVVEAAMEEVAVVAMALGKCRPV